MNQPGSDHILTEVPVAAGTLDSTADLLDILHDFLASAGPAIHREFGACLLGNRDIAGTKDPTLATAIMLANLDEAADLLHTLAGSASRSR